MDVDKKFFIKLEDEEHAYLRNKMYRMSPREKNEILRISHSLAKFQEMNYENEFPSLTNEELKDDLPNLEKISGQIYFLKRLKDGFIQFTIVFKIPLELDFKSQTLKLFRDVCTQNLY